jgi:serine protease AprX
MRRFVALAALLVVVAGLAPVASVSQVQAHDAPILLRAATFRPGLGEEPDLPSSLTAAEPAAGQYGYYLVQFAGPIQPAWKKALAATGAEPVAYVPEFAFKLRMTPAVAARVRRLPGVTWLGPFHPAYKLSPDLVRDGTRLYAVRIERGADARLAAAALARSGAQIVAGEGDVLWLAAGADQVEAIAQVLDVAWIENLALPETHNEYGAGVILGANVANASGYDGSTQTVAVADTGLGGGTASTAHSDIPAGRITAIYNRQGVDVPLCYTVLGDGAQDVASGHGTHTALSVLGNGGAGGEGRGTAPAANLVFQAIEDYADMIGICALVLPDGYYLLGLPTDIRDLFQQAYTAGARIHSNSWGTALTGVYTTQSANTDDFVWNHPEMTITFSAGNAGVDADADGYVDEGSTNSPGTAKNLITVGASENDRQGNWDCDTALNYTDCAAQGGQNDLFTYGAGWPDNFPADPLAGDPSAGNAEQLAAFSSRGPTSDGRIKPDLVAPGTWVLSGYSDLYQEGYDPSPNPQDSAWQYDGWGFPLSAQYKYMGGTSMSNPLTAGAAAVVRDFYQKAHGHGASAALVKATLINSAQDLLDENNDGVNDNDHPIPNNHEGWGRVDLAAATDGSHQFVDEGTGLGTGGSATYPFNIGTAGQPFKVSLVWSDYPSAEAALKNLVNDLDLVVTAPGGAVYWGNVFSGGWSQTGDSADRTNNLENVYLQSAAAGTWTVEVQGYNVPNGPQPYALVMDGASGEVPIAGLVATNDSSTLLGSLTTLAATITAGSNPAYTWAFGDGEFGAGPVVSHTYPATGTYTAVVTASNSINELAATTTVTITEPISYAFLPLVLKDE